MIHLELVERGKELEREVNEGRERRIMMVWNMFLSTNFIFGCDVVEGERREKDWIPLIVFVLFYHSMHSFL